MDTIRHSEASDDQVSDSEIHQALLRKRKVRAQRACRPCRQRKVKCDNKSPCQRCLERGHADLCRYQQPVKRQEGEPSSPRRPSPPRAPAADTDKPSITQWTRFWSKLESVERLLQELKSEFRDMATAEERFLVGTIISDESKGRETNITAPGIQASTGLAGEFVHLGNNSVAAMALAMGHGNSEQVIRDIIGKSVLPIFGLDNESATYPFVDLWGLPPGSSTRVEELCKLIPTDADCHQFLRQYRDTTHILFPGVVDIDQLESDLTRFLIERSSRGVQPHRYPVESSNVYGKTLNWVGLLFACLASGCQCSGLSRKERQLTSQVYGKWWDSTRTVEYSAT